MFVCGADKGVGDLVKDHAANCWRVIQGGQRPRQGDFLAGMDARTCSPARTIKTKRPLTQAVLVHQLARHLLRVYTLHAAP